MESRIKQFRELHENPWFSMMNWVIDEMRSNPANRHIHVTDGWAFYGITSKQLGKAYQFNRMKSVHGKNMTILRSKLAAQAEKPQAHAS